MSCAAPRPPKSIRVVRDRLLVLTTYLVGYMALWTVRSLGGKGNVYLDCILVGKCTSGEYEGFV